MAKYGNYGWSPRQMERVNARRKEQGKEELVNVNNPPPVNNYGYEDEEQPMSKSDYIRQQYRNKLQERKAAEKEWSGMSGAERQAKRMSSFSERFPAPYSKSIKSKVSSQAKTLKPASGNSIASAFDRLS